MRGSYDRGTVDRREIQRLAAAEITPALYRELAEHGEDLLVERKGEIPATEKLGAVVASMANMLGGWILLGVDDQTRELRELKLKPGTDLQSHFGNLLRNAVDPVPPYLAGTLDVDGTRVGFVRVFEASVPVLVRSTGAIYSRDDGGKLPISDHRELLQLARAGREAEEEARERPNQNRLGLSVLGLPASKHPVMDNHLRTIVRAAPLTVTPQLREWPLSRGPNACLEGAQWLAKRLQAPQGFSSHVEPFGRAVAARAAPLQPPTGPLTPHRAVAFADCAGVFGAAASHPVVNVLETHELRREYIRPTLEVVAALLTEAEAYGAAVLDLFLYPAREVHLKNQSGRWERHQLHDIHCGSAILTVPADEEDRAELAKEWEREVARQAGIAMWEKPPGA